MRGLVCAAADRPPSLLSLPPPLGLPGHLLQLDSVALQAALKQQQQQQDGDAAAAQKEEQPALQLFVKDGSRGWAKVPAGATKCPTRGVAARLAQVGVSASGLLAVALGGGLACCPSHHLPVQCCTVLCAHWPSHPIPAGLHCVLGPPTQSTGYPRPCHPHPFPAAAGG